jgi:hypothetical protein
MAVTVTTLCAPVFGCNRANMQLIIIHQIPKNVPISTGIVHPALKGVAWTEGCLAAES